MSGRYSSIFKLINVLLLVFLAFFLFFSQKMISPVSFQGYFIQEGKWANFGIVVNLYRGQELIGQEMTALNGEFEFRNILPGDYQLYFFDSQYFLTKKYFSFVGKPLREKYTFIDKYYHPLFLLETFGFVLAIIILGLSSLLLLRSKEKQYVWPIWLMTLTIGLFSGIEFLQVLLAKAGQEILAGNIFPLKHVGLTWFGFAFLSLLLIFPRPSTLLEKLRLFYALPLAEAILILSWIFLGSDHSFGTVWHLNFGTLRLLVISQLMLLLGLGLWRLTYLFAQEKDIVLKNKIQVLRFGVILFLSIMLILVFAPLVFWHGQEFFPGQYNLTAILAASLLLGFIVYAITSYRVLPFQQLLNRSVTYFIVTSILVCAYAFLIVYLDRSLINFRNYLLNVYIMAFFIALFIPLRARVQRFVDTYFFGDQKAQRQALSAVSRTILRCVKEKDIAQLLQYNLRKYLYAKNVLIQVFTPPKTKLAIDHARPGDGYWSKLQVASKYVLVLPIQDEQCYGLIFLSEKKTQAEYTESELDLLLAMASQAAIALANINLYRKTLLARQELERSQRLASLGTLVAGLAHEIKNPLTALSNMASLLPERHNDKKYLASFQEIVPRQIERINTLVGNMLNFSKTGTDNFKTLELSALLKRVTELLQATARQQKVEIIFEPTIITIKANEKTLEQVFLNLALNALEAMPSGGKLHVRILKQNKRAVVEVEDTGNGIAKDDLERIFDPFFTTKTNGTGLGLSITYHILEQHKAKIKVDSRKGAGTKFTIEF
jgi:signal transduction histidine kinase